MSGWFLKMVLSLILTSLVPLVFLSYVTFSEYRSMIEQTTLNYRAELMRLFSEKSDAFLKQLDTLSMTVFQDQAQQLIVDLQRLPPVERIQSIMELDGLWNKQIDFHGFSHRLKGVYLLDSEGHVIFDGTGLVPPGRGFAGYRPFVEFQQSGENSALIPGLGSFDMLFIRTIRKVATPLQNLGYVALDFGIEQIAANWDPFQLDADSRISILDETGRILFDSDSKKMGQQADSSLTKGTTLTSYTITGSDGYRQLVCTYRSQFSGWTFVTYDSVDYLMQGAAALLGSVVAITVMAALLAILVSLILARGLLQPVRRLRDAMWKVHSGDLLAHVDIRSRDEIGELGLVFNEMLQRIRHLVDEVYTTQLREKESQLEALQAQINPHFLYNTLENIRSIANLEGIDSIERIAKSMSRMFRYSIKPGGPFSTIGEEIIHIRDYLEIVAIRFEGKIQVKIEVPAELEPYPIVRLILQPIVENSIHHGLGLKRGSGSLQVTAVRDGEDILLVVEDDGIGIDEATLSDLNASFRARTKSTLRARGETGVGLGNVHGRIAMYFGEGYGLTIESVVSQGTKVTVRIPLVSSAPFL